MDQNFKASLKSSETEDWLDLHVIRPFCYYCALAFAKFDIHPNTVTIWSMTSSLPPAAITIQAGGAWA